MKKLMIVLLSVVSMNIYAQNHLESGIQSAGRIDFKDDESESVVDNSSISFPDECSAIYKFNQQWTDNFVTKSSSYEVKWHWKDITYIKVDRVLNVLELDTESKIIESSTDDKTHTVVEDDRQSDIGIYFKNIDDVLKAAEWAENKVKNCGGKVVVIK
jgi:hypothetical protein